MSTETQKQVAQGAAAAPVKNKVKASYDERLLSATEILLESGGFDLLESIIENSQNMNPERKARKNIFLNEKSRKTERLDLARSLNTWKEVLESGDDAMGMIELCDKNAQEQEQSLKQNLSTALNSTRELERSYRSMAMFYKNTESDKVPNVSIMNASPDQIKDLDNTRFIDSVAQELKQNYDRLDLRDNYSLMAIPGYLGSNAVIEKWSKIAYENKVTLVTDFPDFEEPDDVMQVFASEGLAGADAHRSNALMTCNWLIGRKKSVLGGEDDDLTLPPSTAYAGKIYNTLMSQVAAGKKHGVINEVEGVRFALKKSEISNLEKLGLIPMVNEYGKVMAFSAKTLFNGDNLGLQTYSVVRVFDYVTKVLMDFLNRRAFENFSPRTKKDMQTQMIHFLDSIKGVDNLIEDFSVKRFEQDPVQKDRIYLDIHMKPYFPAKSFLIKMDGQKGNDGAEWDSEYEQS